MWFSLFQVALFILPSIINATAEWNNPSNPQYHIQTDEGPERYFKYQTLNGQYRREKRLEDGTVIGMYAWIDDDGFLRQRDYIADNAGYRILKIKNLFVGRDMPIGQAVSAAKKFPGSSGSLVATGYLPAKTTPIAASYLPAKTTTVAANYLPVKPTPTVVVTPRPYYPKTYSPFVEISHNSVPSTTEISSFSVPSTTELPPLVSTTPAPEVVSSTPLIYESTTKRYVTTTTNIREEIHKKISDNGITVPYKTAPVEYYDAKPTASTLPPSVPLNSLSFYSGAPQYEHYKDDVPNPYVHQNGPTYPIDENGQSYNGQRVNKIEDDSQYKAYDGVSVTNDGFRYYIPRAYHEEQNLNNDEKTGSFGYIDPFGIRRVIYYNASPDKGFQHRKNNRYVGFNATPYDPRPPV